ncbi:alpha/beta hydrolase [Sphingobacterium suaedae]|uniref:Alpha/beta hydrolase n=1 Tax=Sphingobacterium suaedae TaxID=1686402 RepID=A0ABW5KF49_9SPHI
MMRTLLLLCFKLIAGSFCLAQEVAYETVENISYIDDTTDNYQAQQCQMDIHYPTSGALKPVVIWYHGGGLTGGRREIPTFLKNKGLVVVGVGYRFAPKVRVHDIIEDAAKAVSYVMHHADKYHGDKRKIFLSGHSAGGYLTLMMGLNKTFLEREKVDVGEIAGIISFSGQAITHFTARQEAGIPEKQPTIGELAPLYWVRKDAPPIVLLTGDRELEMLGRYEENAYLKRMLLLVGHPNVQLIEFEGYGHDMTYPGFPILVSAIKRILSEREELQ